MCFFKVLNLLVVDVPVHENLSLSLSCVHCYFSLYNSAVYFQRYCKHFSESFHKVQRFNARKHHWSDTRLPVVLEVWVWICVIGSEWWKMATFYHLESCVLLYLPQSLHNGAKAPNTVQMYPQTRPSVQ